MDYDLIIIGGGPAGYVAAIRAGQVGLKTALVEKDRLGGMCLNWGCIPTKSLLESVKLLERVRQATQFGVDGVDEGKLSFNWANARARAQCVVKRLTGGVATLLARNGVDVIAGEATLVSPTRVRVAGRLLEADNVFIATGSRPGPLRLPVPTEMILEIEPLLTGDKAPRQVVIAGEGPNALELAQLLKLAGAVVTLLVPGGDLLPKADPCLSRYALGRLTKEGIHVRLDTVPTGSFENGILVGTEKIFCDKVLNASAREAVVPPAEFELERDRGSLRTDEYLRTNHPTVFAIGDVNGRSELAHAASAQGLCAVNVVKGIRWKMDLANYPLNIYTHPEMAQVGLTEPEIQARGLDYKVSEFPLAANGKALCEGATEGFVRLLSEKRYGEVLGVQIVAAHATDMIAEAAALLQTEGTVFDLTKIIHAHPTVSEVFLEAGYAAVDHAIHI
jgi:dihydrolipoamide dehydrogenase